jgi:NHL repeat
MHFLKRHLRSHHEPREPDTRPRSHAAPTEGPASALLDSEKRSLPREEREKEETGGVQPADGELPAAPLRVVFDRVVSVLGRQNISRTIGALDEPRGLCCASFSPSSPSFLGDDIDVRPTSTSAVTTLLIADYGRDRLVRASFSPHGPRSGSGGVNGGALLEAVAEASLPGVTSVAALGIPPSATGAQQRLAVAFASSGCVSVVDVRYCGRNDGGDAAGATASSLSFFTSRTASAETDTLAVVSSRRIGASEQRMVGDYLGGIALDAMSGQLFVCSMSASGERSCVHVLPARFWEETDSDAEDATRSPLLIRSDRIGLTELHYPVACAVDSSRGRLYVSDIPHRRRLAQEGVITENHVVVFDLHLHNMLFKIGGGLLQRPDGIAVDQQGRLVVADQKSKCVFVFDTNGRHLSTIGSELGMPVGVARFVNCSVVFSPLRLSFDTHCF